MSEPLRPVSAPTARLWQLRPVSGPAASDLASALNISLPLAKLLLARGLASDVNQARRFLKPDVMTLPNPFLLTDMDRAVELTRQAVAERRPILVHGDRDVDGVAATSLLVHHLRGLGADVSGFVPGEVYGIAVETIESAAARGVRLLITVDCGTTAHAQIARARELGVDVIVLDHHQPEGGLPPASALVNPNRPDCSYEPKLLSGSGVSFKFAWALHLAFEPAFDEEFVALDFETTGLEPTVDEIIEIAAVRFKRGLELDHFHCLVRPGLPIPAVATSVHGIDDAAVANAEPIEACLPRLLHFIGSRRIVAHNAEFDVAFLDRASRKVLGSGFTNRAECTRNWARELLPDMESHRLAAMCQHFGIETPRFHRALDDARAAGELYYRLLRLASRARRTAFYQRSLGDLTLGTLADVVPLLGENRVLCHFGLRALAQDRRPGIRALCQRVAPDGRRLVSRDVTFGIAPLLNAAGRAGRADLALSLLCTESAAEADLILGQLDQLRSEGRSRAQAMFDDLRARAPQHVDLEHDRVLVFLTRDHKRGVTGVVANRLLDEFGRPTVVLIDDGHEVRGSARAPEGFDLLEILRSAGSELERFGGHRQAAGVSVLQGRVEEFRKAVNIAADELYPDQPLACPAFVDLELSMEDIGESLVAELSTLEPFGAGNPPPVFQLSGAVPREARRIGQDAQHLKLTLGAAQRELHALWWNFPASRPVVAPGEPLDLVFCLETNEYQGRRELRLKLLDLRMALPPAGVKE